MNPIDRLTPPAQSPDIFQMDMEEEPAEVVVVYTRTTTSKRPTTAMPPGDLDEINEKIAFVSNKIRLARRRGNKTNIKYCNQLIESLKLAREFILSNGGEKKSLCEDLEEKDGWC